jgi:antitoxin component of MazEF toxin-antitoxin module
MHKIIRSGNSLAITIPAKFAKKLGIKAGDEVSCKTDPHRGKMIIAFKNIRQLSLIK